MITLEGKNLCERQKDLNFQVKRAAEENVRLEDVTCAENSDVDRIFKIDLASEYKNIEYIIQELKSGDSLYVSRALKCKWLYTREYAHLFNSHYLHYYIFPKMSFKMKKKTLTVCSANIRNPTRAEDFYNYCMGLRLTNNADKFLIFTSAPFKISVLNKRSEELVGKEPVYFQHLIGSSFYLAHAYARNKLPLIHLSYLYSLDEENYLNLLETYRESSQTKYFGVKTSRSVMKKHKNRVLRNASLYLNYLIPNVVVMYSSCDDAQIYLRAVLPRNEEQFWNSDYCNRFKHLIGLLTTVSKFQFVKQIFEEQYNTSDFELKIGFIELRYIDLMNLEEKKTWLKMMFQMQERITRSFAVLSEGDNYKWCQFMKFAKAFLLIDYLLRGTTDIIKRCDMLRVLVKSVSTENDLETLLNYYYNKLVLTEPPAGIGIFLQTVIKTHNVFDFNNACWVAFDMILQNFRLHNYDWPSNNFLAVSFIYRVINDKTLPEHLRYFIHDGQNYNDVFAMHLKKLKKKDLDLVYHTMISEILKTILGLASQDPRSFTREDNSKVCKYLQLFLDCRRQFKIEDDYPDVVMKLMKLNFNTFKSFIRKKYKNKSKLTEGYLLRCLKQDASQILEKLPSIIDEHNVSNTFRRYRIDMLLKKMKIFFTNDVAKQCLEYFTKVLYGELPYNPPINSITINGIVFAIFHLGDETSKIALMDKFAPTESRVELNDYTTQVAICRFHVYSRPPVPLCKTALYLNLLLCEQMLYMYLSNLPRPLCTNFIKLLWNSPFLIQKRGIHLVFQGFKKMDELKHTVCEIWNETRSIALRKKIYLVNLKRFTNGSIEIIYYFSLLLQLTMQVRQDDDPDIFKKFDGERIPEAFRNTYLDVCWQSLARWPETQIVYDRKIIVANSILLNKDLMRQEFLHWLVHDEIKRRFQRRLPVNITVPSQMDSIFSQIQFFYITDISDDAKQARSLKIVELFTVECFKRWNLEHPTGILYYQEICYTFISDILKKPEYFGPKFLRLINVAEKMLEHFENNIGIVKAYSRFWDWQLALITRKAIQGKEECNHGVYINFGHFLGDFVKKLKNQNRYYISFLDKVFRKILSSVNDMHKKKNASVSVKDASVLIAYGLVRHGIFENYILALKILPTDLSVSPVCRTILVAVIRIIQSQDNEEFSAFISDKYDNSEAKSRRLMEQSRDE